jgi:hypothetical protein
MSAHSLHQRRSTTSSRRVSRRTVLGRSLLHRRSISRLLAGTSGRAPRPSPAGAPGARARCLYPIQQRGSLCRPSTRQRSTWYARDAPIDRGGHGCPGDPAHGSGSPGRAVGHCRSCSAAPGEGGLWAHTARWGTFPRRAPSAVWHRSVPFRSRVDPPAPGRWSWRGSNASRWPYRSRYSPTRRSSCMMSCRSTIGRWARRCAG